MKKFYTSMSCAHGDLKRRYNNYNITHCEQQCDGIIITYTYDEEKKKKEEKHSRSYYLLRNERFARKRFHEDLVRNRKKSVEEELKKVMNYSDMRDFERVTADCIIAERVIMDAIKYYGEITGTY